ncbi:uncharacterized protein LOC129571653, partial [Sitodiplosis mosellana]|uniref:uncharacterized protein LOC129571653 n=1 Tax=Sitodiplosis mosellana TaxID=263140 RepID=UPI0024449A89
MGDLRINSGYFVKIRWEVYAYNMLLAIAKHFYKLYTLLYEKQRANTNLTCFNLMSSLKLDELKATSEFLVPFKDLTVRLEGEKYETLSLVWPIFAELWIYLQPDTSNTDERPGFIIEQMKAAGLNYYLSREKYFKPTLRHKIATVLNPQFKRLPSTSVSPQQLELIHDKIESMCTGPVPDVSRTAGLQQETSDEMVQKVHPFFRSFCSFNVNQSDVTQMSELQKYLFEDVNSLEINVTDYWNENRLKYPQLFKLFARISCIPATSSSGERIFSHTVLIVNSLRSNILPNNVNNIMI